MNLKGLDFIIFTAALSVFVFVTWKVYADREGSPILLIQSAGEEYLFPLDEDRELTFTGAAGKSVVVIQGGEAYIRSSECKEQICVQMGKIDSPGEWVACLPNQLLLRVKAEKEGTHEEIDGRSY